MTWQAAITLCLLLVVAPGASAQVLRVGDLNTSQIRALDRAKTVVFLQGGMLEEHGPYLPAFTDGILSERLTREVAAGVVAGKPGWTALLLPPIGVGASGSNEIGKQFVFPGTYAVRPSTLRALFMDLATELGEQGFQLGRQIWTSFSSAALTTTLEILNGADLAKYPRYLDYLRKLPLYQDWIRAAEARDSAMDQKQRAWLAARKGK